MRGTEPSLGTEVRRRETLLQIRGGEWVAAHELGAPVQHSERGGGSKAREARAHLPHGRMLDRRRLRRALEAQHGQAPVASDVLDLEASAPVCGHGAPRARNDSVFAHAAPARTRRNVGVPGRGVAALAADAQRGGLGADSRCQGVEA